MSLKSLITDWVSFRVSYYSPTLGTTSYRNVQIPYYYGGKNIPADVRMDILQESSNWINGELKSNSIIQTYVNNNVSDTGVDCSGFVYYVLNEWTGNNAVMKQFNNTSYSDGVNAIALTDTSNGTLITAAKDVEIGCTIRTHNGGHVLVVYEIEMNGSGEVTKIKYAHSSDDADDNTPQHGPSLGYVTIGNEDQDLDGTSQTFYDPIYTNTNYLKANYNHTILLDSLK